MDSAYFADKGLQAAYGKETGPENLEDWDVDPQILPIMRTAHDTLVEVLNSGARKSMPKIAKNVKIKMSKSMKSSGRLKYTVRLMKHKRTDFLKSLTGALCTARCILKL